MKGLQSNALLSKKSIFGLVGSNVKSIQKGTVTFTSGSLTQSITISSVDTTKSVIMITASLVAGGGSPATVSAKAQFTNATTISLTRSSSSHTVEISWQVIEFNNVRSLQSGQVTVDATSKSATISSINTSKSVLFFTFSTTAPAVSYDYGSPYVEGYINSSTEIVFKSYITNGQPTVYWFVIEFN